MNIFEETDYREVLRKVVQERKRLDASFSFRSLAEAIGIQNSYLSKVMHGSADLTTDQLFLAAEFLEFTETQRNYLELLLEYSRSQLKKRQEALLRKIKRLQAKYLETRQALGDRTTIESTELLYEYYLDPYFTIVHNALGIARYQSDLPRLASDLGIPLPRLASLVNRLEQFGFIRRQGGKVTVTLERVHLPRESPVFPAWINNLRVAGMNRMRLAPKETWYGFSAVFSSSQATRARTQARFLELLKELDGAVRTEPADELFQLNFDLFSWS